MDSWITWKAIDERRKLKVRKEQALTEERKNNERNYSLDSLLS